MTRYMLLWEGWYRWQTIHCEHGFFQGVCVFCGKKK